VNDLFVSDVDDLCASKNKVLMRCEVHIEQNLSGKLSNTATDRFAAKQYRHKLTLC
jgi:hypothetical protein